MRKPIDLEGIRIVIFILLVTLEETILRLVVLPTLATMLMAFFQLMVWKFEHILFIVVRLFFNVRFRMWWYLNLNNHTRLLTTGFRFVCGRAFFCSLGLFQF